MGNVGIGTTTPDSKLTIVGTGANGFSLGTSGNVGFGGYAIQNRDKGGLVKALVYVNGDGALRIETFQVEDVSNLNAGRSDRPFMLIVY